MALFSLEQPYINYPKKESHMYIIQRVLNHLKNVNPSIRTYVLCLILSGGRKNCSDMARSVGISPKWLYVYLSKARINSREIEKLLFDYAKQTRNKDIMRTLVIDPTSIIKRYAHEIEKLCYDKAGCTKHVEHCLVPVYASVVDEKITIPLTFNFWVQKKLIVSNRYKSKVKIAQNLITNVKNKGLDFDFVSLDGAFPVPKMFSFLNKESVNFIMRIAKSRCVKTADGKRAQLKHHPTLKLMRNEREKTVQAELNGIIYFFTAQKRKNKHDEWETIFLVSNMNLSAKEQVKAFGLRWPQEKINRTTKQKFGSNQCQALQAKKQSAHIMACFLAYSILELAQNDKRKQSVDELVNFIRRFHFNDLVDFMKNSKKNKSRHNSHLVAKKIQNDIQNLSNNAYESSVLYV